MREGWSAEQLEISALSLGLSQRIGLILSETWGSYSNQLTTTLLAKIISANQLKDVDWSFGVTASTEDCDKVCFPSHSLTHYFSHTLLLSLFLCRLVEPFFK